MIDVYEREIRELEAKEKSEDPEVAEEEEEELAKTHQKLADEIKAIDDLEKSYNNAKKDWCDSEHRNIGTSITLHPSPSASGMRSLPRTGVRS